MYLKFNQFYKFSLDFFNVNNCKSSRYINNINILNMNINIINISVRLFEKNKKYLQNLIINLNTFFKFVLENIILIA